LNNLASVLFAMQYIAPNGDPDLPQPVVLGGLGK
jgi:hypothetical protein